MADLTSNLVSMLDECWKQLDPTDITSGYDTEVIANASVLLARAAAELASLQHEHDALLRGRKPTHRCKVCGALWIDWGASWSLFSRNCGKCCDNVAMGNQIEALPVIRQDETTARISQRAQSDEECCGVRSPSSFVCTLVKGHSGQHEAYGHKIIESWPTETSAPQAPIARMMVADGFVTWTHLKAPGLPDGMHDVFCEPEVIAPYLGMRHTLQEIRDHSTDTWARGLARESVGPRLCTHGMPADENVCGPCSRGEPNRRPGSPEEPRETSADDTEDMANIGRALMERLPKDYHWNDCPTEIVTDLLNQIHDLKRAPEEPRETAARHCGIEFNVEGKTYRCSLATGHVGGHGRIELLVEKLRASEEPRETTAAVGPYCTHCGQYKANSHYPWCQASEEPVAALPEHVHSWDGDQCHYCHIPRSSAVKAAQHAITCPCHPYQEKAAVRDCSCGAVNGNGI